MRARTRIPAVLALEDGSVFHGTSFGSRAEASGEFVFNTGMTGYQEILTDPSYKGQVVVMTVPHVGNYGINDEDGESEKPRVEGFVVREACRTPSNWRSRESLPDYLARHGIPGIEGVDTRALVLLLREKGAMRGVISTGRRRDSALIERAKAVPRIEERDLVSEVTCVKPYEWKQASAPGFPGEGRADSQMRLDFAPRMPRGSFHVVVVDCGVKRNILRCLASLGCRVTVVPAFTGADDIISLKPDGVLFSNGPGDPGRLPGVSGTVGNLAGKVPLFGICLGHQVMGRALGGRTFKLKFGHHGGNHPVMNLASRAVAITVQNHNFAVDPESLPGGTEVTHLNLNDRTVEGLRHRGMNMFSVQYHPEAAPGPHDAMEVFGEFIGMMSGGSS